MLFQILGSVRGKFIVHAISPIGVGNGNPLQYSWNIFWYSWKIPWTEEPGGLQSIGSQTVGRDSAEHSSSPHSTLTHQLINGPKYTKYSNHLFPYF